MNLEQRLEELQQEYQRGQQRLAELERTANSLRATLLRIEGAMQVLRELASEQLTNEEKEDKIES